MSDHAWTQDQIAAAVADGLTADEAERLDRHVRDCPECAAALADARRFDGTLQALFAPARPAAALEDRAVQAFRATETRRRLRAIWRRRLAVGIAASIGIGVTGFAVDHFPGMRKVAPAAPYGLTTDSIDAMTTAENLGWIDVNSPVRASDKFGGDRQNYITSPDASNETQKSTKQSPLIGSTVIARQAPLYPEQKLVYPKLLDGKPTDAEPFGVTARIEPEAREYLYYKPADLKPALPALQSQVTAERDMKGTTRIFQSGGAVADRGEQNKSSDKELDVHRLGDSLAAATSPPAKAEAAESPPARNPEAANPRKIVIRIGELEFEVESFDAAVATATRLVLAIDGAFVATINSDKLANGKMKGSIVLRVPPDRLDGLVLDLRKDLGKGGELKGQRIGSQDITKQYTDLESRLRAARTMEGRLLQIIKEGKGEIKQLLEAEKELGVWRTRIEEYEGELRYYANQVALSTLTLTLAEKEIRTAATVTDNERVQAGIEVEDVDKALQAALAAVTEAKGRVSKSELKQLAAGQFNATLHCELPPEAAGPFRDRLQQLGHVARLEIDRVQQSDGRTPAPDARTKRGDTQFLVQFYNLANVAPREAATLVVAVADVPAGYQALREAVGKAHGRVLSAQLDEQDRQNVTARLDFEVRRPDEPALASALASAGEVVSRNVARATDGENRTDAKVLFRTTLVSAIKVTPRETTTLAVEVPDVDAAMTLLTAEVAEAKGRTVDAQAAHERAGRVTARLAYDVPLAAAPALVEKLKALGTVRVQQSARNLQAPDGRFATARLDVTLSNTDLIVAKDDGLWPQIRRGLSLSVTVLLMSVTWVVFGLCVVLPWAAVGYGGYRVFRRLAGKPAVAAPPAPPAA